MVHRPYPVVYDSVSLSFAQHLISLALQQEVNDFLKINNNIIFKLLQKKNSIFFLQTFKPGVSDFENKDISTKR